MIRLPVNTAAIKLQVIASIRPEGEVQFRLYRKGCHGGEIERLLAIEQWPYVQVQLTGAVIPRGYYMGILSIGCEELCQVDFYTGQNLCVSATPVLGNNRIGMVDCEPDSCHACAEGMVRERTYRVIEQHQDGMVVLLAEDACFVPPVCEDCGCSG